MSTRGARRTASRSAPASALSEREEETMKAIVARELGMERGREQVPFARGDDRPVRQGGEGLDVLAEVRDLRRADEDGVVGAAGHALHRELRFEGIQLPAEGVALDRDVHER